MSSNIWSGIQKASGPFTGYQPKRSDPFRVPRCVCVVVVPPPRIVVLCPFYHTMATSSNSSSTDFKLSSTSSSSGAIMSAGGGPSPTGRLNVLKQYTVNGPNTTHHGMAVTTAPPLSYGPNRKSTTGGGAKPYAAIVDMPSWCKTKSRVPKPCGAGSSHTAGFGSTSQRSISPAGSNTTVASRTSCIALPDIDMAAVTTALAVVQTGTAICPSGDMTAAVTLVTEQKAPTFATTPLQAGCV